MRFAEVALQAPVNRTFTYHIPPELEDKLAAGSLVRVEFRVAMEPGVIVAFKGDSAIPKTKPIIELLDPQPVLSAEALELARWLSETTLSPIGACIWLMLPPGFTGRSDRLFRFLADKFADDHPQQMTLPGAAVAPDLPLDRVLLAYLHKRGPKRLGQIKAAFPKLQVERELDRLLARGMVGSESVLAPPVAKKKTTKRIYPLYAVDRIADIVGQLGRSAKHADLLELIANSDDDALGVEEALSLVGAKNRAPLRRLIDEGLVFVERTESGEQDLVFLEATLDEVAKLLETWRGTAVYAALLREICEADPSLTLAELRETSGASVNQIKKLERAGLVAIREEQVWRDSLRDFDFVPDRPPVLTPDQQAVWDVVQRALLLDESENEKRRRFLLHGVTGSGKTEIYLRAIGETLRQGRQAIFLVPEIALTPQTIRRVSERFPRQVAIVHGSLPIGERYDTWQRARRGEIKVVVGTRSALFTPLPDLGLVILDEEHDASYKQVAWMNRPQYQARDAAAYLMRLRAGVLILGSATPDLRTWYRAQKGEFTYLRLPNRIMGHRQRIHQQAQRARVESRYQPVLADALHIGLPPVSVVDMRRELRAGNTHMFSRELRTSLSDALQRGEQTMLLLNRRGQATYVFCRDCGYVLACARCDTPMTWHRIDQSLRCHHCGFRQPQPDQCPECGSTRIRYFGAGTQQVDEAVGELFPDARTLRWDIDSASKPQMHYEILQRFIEGEADVLIGTQMIAKGLDLPLVTLVGVVSADPGLALPDFRAGERIFQLLTQVAGRAGRGVLGGKVVLQTYQPEHYVIQAAARHDYDAFVERELTYRRELGYPPFRRLARIVFNHTDPRKAQAQAEAAAEQLRAMLEEQDRSATSLIGPAPCFFSRIDRRYRWHVLLRGPDPRAIINALTVEPGWQIDLDPIDLL